MESRNFYIKILAATISVMVAGTAVMINLSYRGLVAAILTVAAGLLIRNAEKSSRKTGRTDRMKAVLEAVRPGAELLLISTGFVAYAPSTFLTVTPLSLVAFSEIYRRSVDEAMEFFGQEVRVGLLIVAFTGSYFNEYILFYGLLAVGLVAAFDSLYMLYRGMENSF